MRFSQLLFAILAVAPTEVLANGLVPGTYFAGKDSGQLILSPAAGGKVKLRINAEGANGHPCEVAGEISASTFEAKVPTDNGVEHGCVVRFKQVEKGYAVFVPESSFEACRYFCGARATFDREYKTVEPQCLGKAVKDSRRRFAKAYRSKAYAAAIETLAPLLERCTDNLSAISAADVRNDLAIAMHHTGDDAGCRRVLGPLKDFLGMTDSQVRTDFGTEPAFVEDWVRIVRAVNTNWTLCAESKRDQGRQ